VLGRSGPTTEESTEATTNGHAGPAAVPLPSQRRPVDDLRPGEPDEPAWAAVPEFDPPSIRQILERAERAGISAVWTADYSGTVELRRLAGPRDRLVSSADWHGAPLRGPGPWRLSRLEVQTTVYEHCLIVGTQYEIYRWVNLLDLARLWPRLHLPPGVRAEWARALRAGGLLPPAPHARRGSPTRRVEGDGR
jgi:hypothetical protein